MLPSPNPLSRFPRIIAIILLFTFLVGSSIAQIRVLPLGDAIVLGTGSSTNNVGGFRDDLHMMLNAGSMPFDFVGSLNDGFSPDPHHEGHAGTTVDVINQNLPLYLQQFRPHLVIVHLGTEELIQTGDVTTILNGLTTTVNTISDFSAETEIYMCTLIPNGDVIVNNNINQLNTQIVQMVNTQKALGKNIYLVDLNQAFVSYPNWLLDYMSTNTFPNDLGYSVMATNLYNEITNSSYYIDLQTFTDDFNGRVDLGPKWNAHLAFRITGNELSNSTTQDVWDHMLAGFNAVVNPHTVEYRYSLNADLNGIAEAGVVFLFDSASVNSDGYLVTMNNEMLRLYTLSGGVIGTNVGNLNVGATFPQPGDLFRVVVEKTTQGYHFTASINGNVVGTVSDPAATDPNRIHFGGVMLHGNRKNNIDDFYVNSMVDETPPAPVTDLSLIRSGAASVQLQWTATGDDGNSGQAARYDLRYALFPITESNFSRASGVELVQAPKTAAAVETVFVSGLKPNSHYYFALKVIDDNNNSSTLSNLAETFTQDAVYFFDDFDRGNPGANWSVDNGVTISGGQLISTLSGSDWNGRAVLRSPGNGSEAGFQWASSTPASEIEKAALLFKLGTDAPQSNGYMIQWVQLNKQFQLWSLIAGSRTDRLDAFTLATKSIVPGDYLKVYFYVDGALPHFVVFVNDVYWGELTDSNNVFGANDPYYAGVIFQGSSTVAVEGFFQYSPVLQPAQLLYVSGDAQVDTVAQVLDQPLRVKVLDNTNAPVAYGRVHFQIQSGNARLFPPIFPDGTIYLEAENGTPVAPMEIGVDTAASGGAYIVTPANSGNNGSIILSFYVTNPGEYYLWGRALAPSDVEDSFFLQVDQQPEFTWSVFKWETSPFWKWDRVTVASGSDFTPYTVHLEAGPHTITVKRREPGTKLDKLIFTKNSLFLPQGKEEVNYYPSDFSGVAQVFLDLGTHAGAITVRSWMDELPGQEVNFHVQTVADEAYQLQYVSGNNQSGDAGTPLPNPFVVQVTDRYGNPVSDYPVQFAVVQGNGQMNPAQVLSDQNGEAAATLTLATDMPQNQVEARAPALAGSPVLFTATASSGFPTKIVYVSGNHQSGGVGTPLPDPLVVKVVDDADQPIPGYTVRFENRSTLGGTLSADSVITSAAGMASVTFTFGTSMGTYQVAAVAEGLQNSPVLFDLTAGPGPATRMIKVSGDSALGVSSYPLSAPFVVQLLDQFGNPTPNESVLFKVVQGGGHFQGDGGQVNVVTDDSGYARATLVLGPETGNYNNRARAEKSGLQGSPVLFVATALPPTASHLSLVDGDGQIGRINQELPAPFRVRVSNAAGDPARNHPVVFHVVSGGGIFTGSLDTVQTVSTDDQGIAQAVLRCGPFAGKEVNVVKVTSVIGSTPLIGSPVWFHASARSPGVKISAVRGNDQQGLIGMQLPIPLEVQVFDAQNQPLSGQQVRFHRKSPWGKLDNGNDTLVVKQTGLTGKASVILTLGNQTGFHNHVVEVTADDGFEPLQGSPVIFYASAAKTNAANLIPVTRGSLAGTVGKSLNTAIVVKVTDSNNQPVADQEVVFQILQGAGSLIGAPHDTLKQVLSDADGIAQVSWILGTKAGAQNNQLRVSASNGVAELQGSPLVFTATARADITDPDISTISASSPVVANGQDRSAITITLRDRYRNPIVGKTVILTASGEFAFLQQPATVTDDSGRTVGYMTSIKSGVKKVYARNSNDNVLLNHAVEILFTPSQASRITITAGNNQHRNVGTVLANPLVINVSDDFNNPVPNYPVTFRARTGNGYLLEQQPVYTDSFGMASAHYVLSDTPGGNVIEADAGALTGSPAIFSVSGEENPPTRMRYESGNNQTGIAGAVLAQPLRVLVVDAAGNPVKNVAITFQATFGTGYVLEPQPVHSDAYGSAAVHVILGRQVGTNLFSASVPGLVGSPFTFLASVRSAEAAKLCIVSGDHQSVPLQSLSQSLIVCVTDQFDNPVVNAPVRFEVVRGKAEITPSQPVHSNSQGNASAALVTGTVSGEVEVSAGLVNRPEVTRQFSLQIVPGPAQQLTVFGSDQLIATVGHLTGIPPQALVTDQFGNPVPGVPVTFVMNSGDATIVGDPEKLTSSQGVATCYLNIGEAVGTSELLATSSGVPGQLLTYHITAVVNQVPVIGRLDDYFIREMETLSFPITADDPDGDSLQIRAEGLPDGATLSSIASAKWRFLWTPTYEQSGAYDLIFSVYDLQGGADWDTVHVEVANVNRVPILTYYYPPGDTSIVPGQRILYEVDAYDADGDEITVRWFRNGTLVKDSSAFVYVSSADFTGQDQIGVTVSDGQDSVRHQWMITVKTAVEMVELTATADQEEHAILISWRTSHEADNLGFKVWRAAARYGPYTLLTSHRIPPHQRGQYSFKDKSVQAGIRYYYKVVDQSISGARNEHGPVEAMIPLPQTYRLEQNFPNPFALSAGQTATRIKFQLPQKESVRITIYNLLGQQVRILAQRDFLPGFYSLSWNGRDRFGKTVSSGIYWYELRAGNFRAIKRLVFIR